MERDFDKITDRLLSGERLPFNLSKSEAWQRVQTRTYDSPVIQIRPANRLRWIAAAASICLLAMGTYFATDKTIVATGDVAFTTTLPDGSEGTLQKGSTIHYNSLLWHFGRNVTLEGKAFFSVRPGSDFTVQTPLGDVVVLGTSFDVSTLDTQLTVACKTGKVGVRLRGKMIETLEPGDMVSLRNNQVDRKKITPEAVGTWMRDDFKFENTPLTDVLGALAVHYAYELNSTVPLVNSYSGQFSKQMALDESLEIVCRPFGLNYTIDQERKLITITKN